MKPRSNRNDPAAVWDLQNPRRDNAVIGIRFYKSLGLTISPRFIAFFMQVPGEAAMAIPFDGGIVRRIFIHYVFFKPGEKKSAKIF